MKEIDDLIVRLRGELSSRIDDRDIVDILEVLQNAQEEIGILQRQVDNCVGFDFNAPPPEPKRTFPIEKVTLKVSSGGKLPVAPERD